MRGAEDPGAATGRPADEDDRVVVLVGVHGLADVGLLALPPHGAELAHVGAVGVLFFLVGRPHGDVEAVKVQEVELDRVAVEHVQPAVAGIAADGGARPDAKLCAEGQAVQYHEVVVVVPRVVGELPLVGARYHVIVFLGVEVEVSGSRPGGQVACPTT